jgi:hypothetical protein
MPKNVALFSSLIVLVLSIVPIKAEWCTKNIAQSGGSFCISGYSAPNNTAEFHISCPRASTRGWCGVGIGRDMPNSDMWMFWFDSSNQVVASDRFGDGTKTPRPDPEQNLQVVDSKVLANGTWRLKIRREYDTGDVRDSVITPNVSQHWFWAVSANRKPTSSDPQYMGDQLIQHDFAERMGSVSLFNGKSVDVLLPANDTDTGVPTDDIVGPTDPTRWMMITHGVLMFIAWGLLAPVGVVIAICCRNTPRFPIHVRCIARKLIFSSGGLC